MNLSCVRGVNNFFGVISDMLFVYFFKKKTDDMSFIFYK